MPLRGGDVGADLSQAAANRRREFDVGFSGIQRDYFGLDGHPPVYGEQDFETRFRVPRNVFVEVYNDVKDLPYWKRSTHATERSQAY